METTKGTSFRIENPEKVNYLYLPLVNESVMSAITPDGHGDNKISQESFLLEPVSAENLHSSMAARNFWVRVKNHEAWSVFGYSARQKFSEEDESVLEAGQFWQKHIRKNEKMGIASSVLSFCPWGNEKAEIMIVTIENTGHEVLEMQSAAAIPIYGRGADRLRDHRHVSSLLHRTKVETYGVTTTPSMAFDEKGHHKNEISYSVFGMDDAGNGPVGAIPTVEEFIGAGGSYIQPKSLQMDPPPLREEGYEIDGYETMGALWFAKKQLLPGQSASYVVVMSYQREGLEYLDLETAKKAFSLMKMRWEEKKLISCSTHDASFDEWMDWVSLQPHLRRIYGCSFLPYHDYGRGGRGWRDLWQDCLALILMKPDEVRENLADFFAGVRIDGTNATIIGSRPGEFIADRNAIVRVWMDHAYWPFRTTALYLEQTGDYEFLFETRPYFRDQTVQRGEECDSSFKETSQNQLFTAQREVYQGTLFEHLLLQQLAQFFDVGEHNHMRLRGADWNDALDMASEKGESVAFTAAYAGNLMEMAQLCRTLQRTGRTTVRVFEELELLISCNEKIFDDVPKKRELLRIFCRRSQPAISGCKVEISLCNLEKALEKMGSWISRHIQSSEVVGDHEGFSWFNGYYDNDGNQVEGKKDSIVKMMLTSQVFTILSGTAGDEQVEKICRAADHYLYDEKAGGYRLNTDFGENKMNLGRMFGFAYGHKENGAVFCHMSVMYAYALYSRGFVKEGYKTLNALKKSSMDFEVSGIYPSIPEYFAPDGRGMYTYLTGAGSWMVLTVLTQMFGIRGEEGNLRLNPQLLREQFGEDGKAEIRCRFAGRSLKITYINRSGKEYGDYEVDEIRINGEVYLCSGDKTLIQRASLEELPEQEMNEIQITLS